MIGYRFTNVCTGSYTNINCRLKLLVLSYLYEGISGRLTALLSLKHCLMWSVLSTFWNVYLIYFYTKKKKQPPKPEKNQWNPRKGTNSSRDVHEEKATSQLMLSHRYFRLVALSCCRLAYSSLESFFVRNKALVILYFNFIFSRWNCFLFGIVFFFFCLYEKLI